MTNQQEDTGEREAGEKPGNHVGRTGSGRLTGLVAALDAALAVLANKFFDDGPWVPIVILIGVTNAFDREKPSPTPEALCEYAVGEPGVVEVKPGPAAPESFTACPALLNNGAPMTGAFTVEGRFGGPPESYRDLVVVGRAVQDICDVYGNRPDPGFYYQSSLAISADGRWSFRDSVGYAEAVTLARDYQFIAGSPEVITAIRSDRTRYAEKNNGDEGYTGMADLPTGARVVAAFRQPPGTYDGRGPAPCKAD